MQICKCCLNQNAQMQQINDSYKQAFEDLITNFKVNSVNFNISLISIFIDVFVVLSLTMA